MSEIQFEKIDDSNQQPPPVGDWSELPPERREVLIRLYQDTCDLLKHRIEGQMANWAYINGGKKYLERFFEHPQYEGNHEKNFLGDLAGQFVGNLKGKKYVVIEIGVGKTFDSKTSKFMDEFNKVAQNGGPQVSRYIPVDLVPEYAESAAKQAKEKYGIDSTPLVSDFMRIKGQLVTDLDPDERVLVLSFNSPIWNSACKLQDMDPKLVHANQVLKVRSLSGPNSDMFITHYPANDAEGLKQLYRSDDCRKAVLAIPELAEKELAPVCKYREGPNAGEEIRFSECFNYDVNYDHESEMLQMRLVSKDNIDVKIGDRFVKTMDKGEEFIAVSSAKPSIKLFNEIARTAGAEVHNTRQNPYCTIVGQHLHFNNG